MRARALAKFWGSVCFRETERDGARLGLMCKERERSPPLVINYVFSHIRPLIIKRTYYAKHFLI